MMTIHFHADLRPVVGGNTGMLHWILDPEARGFLIAYDIEENHVLIHNIDPTRDPIASFSPDKCLEIVRAAVGRDIPIDFQCSMPWVLRRSVANQYFQGRAVLAGDSAHSFPPTGGLGLNSGIGDAHNLAFKLVAWYHGWANLGAVLTNYEDERRPVAIRNSIQSVDNGRKIFQLLKAVRNTNPDITIARREMAMALADPKQMAHIQALIEDQAGHFENVSRYQYPLGIYG
jgi:2-polyprenyl-6-methoxyphenol hydroxylase-like FAD-dependent oxidoreductase